MCIHHMSSQPVSSTNECTISIKKTSLAVLLNKTGTPDAIYMNNFGLVGIDSVFPKGKYVWTAWQPGTSQLYIFEKQWHGASYFMTVSNNSFVVESRQDITDAVLCNDSRLFEWKY